MTSRVKSQAKTITKRPSLKAKTKPIPPPLRQKLAAPGVRSKLQALIVRKRS